MLLKTLTFTKVSVREIELSSRPRDRGKKYVHCGVNIPQGQQYVSSAQQS